MNAKLCTTNSRTQYNSVTAISIIVIVSNRGFHNEYLLVTVVVVQAIPLAEHPIVHSVSVHRYGSLREIEGVGRPVLLAIVIIFHNNNEPKFYTAWSVISEWIGKV